MNTYTNVTRSMKVTARDSRITMICFLRELVHCKSTVPFLEIYKEEGMDKIREKNEMTTKI